MIQAYHRPEVDVIGKRVGNDIHFTGVNTDFTAVWDINKQEYRVYKSGKLLRTLHRFGDVRPYLN